MINLSPDDDRDAWVSAFIAVSPYPDGSESEMLVEVASLMYDQIGRGISPEDAAAAVAQELQQRIKADSQRDEKTIAAMDPLNIEIAELSLLKTSPSIGSTSLVEVFGKTADGRELVLSIRGDHLERLIKSLSTSIRQ